MFFPRLRSFIRFSLLFVVFGLVPGMKMAIGQTQTTYYFAILADSAANGDGLTPATAFKGNARSSVGPVLPAGWSSWFDYNMHSLGANSQIELAPGTYVTNGFDDGLGTHGFLLQANTRLAGAGMGVTTIKLVNTNSASGGTHTVICSGDASLSNLLACQAEVDNVTVENLTVDCNGTLAMNGNPTNSYDEIGGVYLAGNNCSIRSVECINSYGRTAPVGSPPGTPSTEGFALFICGASGNITNVAIQNCIVRNPIGDYVTAIHLGGWYNPSISRDYTGSGIISGNVVIGDPWVAYGGGGTTNSVYSNNIAQNVGFGFRMDTGTFTNIVFTGNTFAASGTAFQLVPQIANHPVGNITIRNNTFSGETAYPDPIQGQGVIDLSSLNGTPVGAIDIEGNTISSNTNPSFPALNLNATAAPLYSSITFSGNKTSLTLPPASAIINYGTSPSYNTVTAQNLVATNSVSGSRYMASKPLDPIFQWQGTSGGTGNQIVDFIYRADLGKFWGRLVTDDNSNANNWMELSRSGLSPLTFSLFTANTYVYGAVQVTGNVASGGAITGASSSISGHASTGSLSVGTGGNVISSVLAFTPSPNIGNVPANSEATFTCTISPASATGSPDISVTWTSGLPAHLIMKSAWLSAANTLSMTFYNPTSSAINPGARQARVVLTYF